MARGTDLSVNLETSSDCGSVVGSNNPVMGPLLSFWVFFVGGCIGTLGNPKKKKGRDCSNSHNSIRHLYTSFFKSDGFKTASEILAGRGKGFSRQLTQGMITKKCKK